LTDPQAILMLVMMASPVLHYAKQDQDVFGWASVVQYVLLAWLTALAVRQPGWRAQQADVQRPVWLLFWVLVLYLTIVSLVNSPVFLNAAAGYIKHTQFLPLLLVASAIGVRSDLWRRWYVPYLLVTVALLALPGVLVAVGVDGALLSQVCEGLGLRCPGTDVRYAFGFGNPNQLAVFLVSAMAMILFLGLSDLARRPGIMLLTLLAFCLGGYAVHLTYSGRVWMILPPALLLGGSLQRGRRLRGWMIAGIVVAIVIAIVYIVYIRERGPQSEGGLSLLTPSGVAREFDGLELRLAFWKQVTSFIDTPAKLLFGLGAGTLGHATRNYLYIGYPTVDGYYAILLGEYGLVGLTLYIALVMVALRRLVRAVFSRVLDVLDEQAVTTLVVGAVLVLLAGLVGNANSSFPLGLNLWCFLGAGLALSRGTAVAASGADV
jgi:hypothetical protein